MSSLRRINASRANGRRSLGLITAEGKARSAQNGMTHGLLSKIVCLNTESDEAFQQMLDDHLIRFQPADGVENEFVEQMVAAWRLRRAWAVSNQFLNAEAYDPRGGDGLNNLATLFVNPQAQHTFDLFMRYETAFQRSYQRAFQNLLVLRTLNLRSEPSPENEHLAPEAGPTLELAEPESLTAGETDPDPL